MSNKWGIRKIVAFLLVIYLILNSDWHLITGIDRIFDAYTEEGI